MEKLQTNITLGIGSNYFSIAGVLAAWVVLMKTGWRDGFWETIFASMAVAPAMMGDALDSYFLNRVRVDTEKGWNDVFITEAGRNHLTKFHVWHRLHSLLSAGFLAGILLVGFSSDPSIYQWFRPVFGLLFLTLSLRCLFVQIRYLAPALTSRRVPAFGKRWVFVLALGALWFWWLYARDPGKPFSPMGMALHGLIYFFLCGILHPLPSRYSILHLDRNPGPRLPREIKVFPDGTPNPLLETDMKDQLPLWQNAGFTPLSVFSMPLLEMPIFQTVGQAWIGPERRVLLLLQVSEGRENAHRTLVSWRGDQILISSDFGAATARFPEGIHYQSIPRASTPTEALQQHFAFTGADLHPAADPVWPLVNQILGRMMDFLRTELVSSRPVQSPERST